MMYAMPVTLAHSSVRLMRSRRLIDRLAVVYTTKRGSRLNMAEIELGIPSRQYMGGRIPDKLRLVDQM
ncbi:MAG: hypothetical protein KA354_15185 [Phycisphaerae bacterium]|nr:hypothetical protein [Phycisphaerae bacterium]